MYRCSDVPASGSELRSSWLKLRINTDYTAFLFPFLWPVLAPPDKNPLHGSTCTGGWHSFQQPNRFDHTVRRYPAEWGCGVASTDLRPRGARLSPAGGA